MLPLNSETGDAFAGRLRTMLACILVLPLALHQSVDASMQSGIDAAIDRGVAHLLSHYGENATGATVGFDPRRADWGEPNGDGVHALILYTLLKCGVERDHAVVHRLLNRLALEEIDRTYSGACLILALEYIHKNKFLHRDVKPENIVFDERGFLRLTDFGIARKENPNNEKETSGTPGYMAPEVMCRQPHTYAVDY